MRISAGRVAWVAAGVLGALGVILLTPFLLKAMGPKDADWERLSQISQAYGALSVILSAGALAGVALSLAHQARQNRIATEETTWSAHRELLLLSLSDTEFLPCWEPPTMPVSQEDWRRMVFTNLIIQDWEKTYVFGLMSDAQLARTFEVHFQGQTARDHWRNSRVHYLRHAEAGTNKRTRRFAQTADRCYEAAVAAGEAVAPTAYFRARPPMPGQPPAG